ncbi:MAG: XRE family transcriptional regulator [Gemmatimonadaceae bacterium]
MKIFDARTAAVRTSGMTHPIPRRRHSRRAGPDAPHMFIRRMLFDLILEIVRRDQLGDYALAHVINTSRTRASSLIKGQIVSFNTETLIDILARLGVSVEIRVARVQLYARHHVSRPRPGWKPFPNTVYG